MPRRQRIVIPDIPLHIVQRGNNRQAVFFSDEDYRVYLDTLGEAAAEHGCDIHAYVLMTNHVHILLTPRNKEAPARLMQALGRKYVRYINKMYRRTGTLWEGRYKSAMVDSENYLLACSRYIELNPQRANMVVLPGEYKWSSYRCNAEGERNELVTPHNAYLWLDDSDERRQAAYQDLFKYHLDDLVLSNIRKGTNNGTYIGNDRFRDEIEAMAERRLEVYEHGGDRKSKRFFGVNERLEQVCYQVF